MIDGNPNTSKKVSKIRIKNRNHRRRFFIAYYFSTVSLIVPLLPHWEKQFTSSAMFCIFDEESSFIRNAFLFC